MQSPAPKQDDTAGTESSATKPKSKRRWLQFSLSTLLLATAGFALWLGLWVDRARRQQRAVEELSADTENFIQYEHEVDSSGRRLPAAEPSAPAWLRRLLGDKYFVDVREVWLRDPTDAELSLLADLPKLRNLKLHGPRVTDDSLAQLGGLTGLKHLDVSVPAVTDAGVAHLSKLPNLERLEFRDVHVSDAGIVQLAGLRRLQVLMLTNSHVTAEGAEKLKRALPNLKIGPYHLPSAPEEKTAVAELIRMGADFTAGKDGKLRHVVFDGPEFTNVSLEVLEGLTRLDALMLHRTLVTATGIAKLRQRLPDLDVRGEELAFDAVPKESEAVAALRKLGAAMLSNDEGTVEKVLRLQGPQITDDDLVHLRALSHLKFLEITAPQVTDAGLEHLAGLTALTGLSIQQSRITDAGLVHLSAMTKLTRIALGGTEITGSGLTHLCSANGLMYLKLWSGPVAGQSLAHLAAFPNLRRLDLTSTPVSDEDLAYLRDCKALEYLSLENTRVRGTGFIYLKELPGLKKLFLTHTSVGDEGLVHLKDCRSLEVLGLGNTQVTDAGLFHVEAITSLKSVYLYGTRVSKEARTRIERRFPPPRIRGGLQAPRGG